MSDRRTKPDSGWRRLAVGVVVLIAVALITILYKQYSAEKLAQEPLARRDSLSPEKPNIKLKPAANVADRPGRDRGPRP